MNLSLGIPLNASTAESLTSPQDDFADWLSVHRIITSVLNVLIITGNALTLACFCRYRALRRNKTILIANLSVADLCVGLSDVGRRLVEISTPPDGCLTGAEQFLSDTPARVAVSASMFSLLVISVDKFIAIVFPLRYDAIVTKRVLLAMIAGAWSVSVLLCLMLLVGNTRETLLSCGALVISPVIHACTVVIVYCTFVIIMSAIYVQILREANRQRQRIQQNSTTESRNLKIDKAHVGVLLILSSFILLIFPLAFQSAMVLASHPVGSSNHLNFIDREAVLLNSCLNVFIYAIYSRDFRRAYKNIFCCRDGASVSPDRPEQ